MDRKFLKSLELEQDTIEQIMSKHGSKVNELEDAKKELKDNNKELNEKLKDIESKTQDTDDLNQRIDALKSQNDKLKQENQEYQEQVASNELDKTILKSVPDAHDADDVFKFIDKDKFEKDEEGNITNFDDVIKGLRETKPYLFKDAQTGNGDNEGNNDGNGDNESNNDGEGKHFSYGTGGKRGNNAGGNDPDAKADELIANIFGTE